MRPAIPESMRRAACNTAGHMSQGLAPALAFSLLATLPLPATARQAPLVVPVTPGQAARPDGPSLSLQGSLGSKAALLVMDGEPLTLSVGQTARGVTLLALDNGRATVQVQGQRRELVMGAAPARLEGRGGPEPGRRIVLSAGSGGHFYARGSINGHATQFLVDTGATSVAIGQAEADRMGLRYRDGRRVTTQTANGPSPAYLLTLASVRVGEVELRNVEAIVVPSAMSHVLLGNSFLSRFQLRRDNDILTLEQRY